MDKGKTKIEEITDEVAKMNMAPQEAVPVSDNDAKSKTITAAEAIGHPCVTRLSRTYWLPDLPLKEILDAQEQKANGDLSKREALYIVPLALETNQGALDKIGAINTTGLTHIGSFGMVWESDLEKAFPSLIRFSKWRNMFENVFEIAPEYKKLTEDRDGPIFQLVADRNPAFVEGIIAICVRDLLQITYGPMRI